MSHATMCAKALEGFLWGQVPRPARPVPKGWGGRATVIECYCQSQKYPLTNSKYKSHNRTTPAGPLGY